MPKAIDASKKLTVKATLLNKLPAPARSRAPRRRCSSRPGSAAARSVRSSPSFKDAASGTSDASGNVSLSADLDRTGQLQLHVPQFQDLTATTADLGATRVTASLKIGVKRDGSRVKLSGKLYPDGHRQGRDRAGARPAVRLEAV